MSKQHLDAIIHEINVWASFAPGGHKIDSEKITQVDADRIFGKIDAGLSPENLHCDGEASPAHVRKTYAKFQGAVKELVKRGFRPTTSYEIPRDWLK